MSQEKAAYLAGIIDGFNLARTKTKDEAEALITEINKADVEARIRAAPAELRRRQAIDAAAERDPETRLN
jgi:hypothetical protein